MAKSKSVLINITPNISESDVKKEVKKLDKIYNKSAVKAGKIFNSKIGAGVAGGLKKGAKAGGKALAIGGLAGVALGAVGAFVGSSDKGLSVKEQTENQANAVTALSEIGNISTNEVLKVINGLTKTGLSFDESITSFAKFLDKRTSFKEGSDVSFAQFSRGNAVEDFKNFTSALGNVKQKDLQVKLGSDVFGSETGKVFRQGNVTQQIQQSKGDVGLSKQIERITKQSQQEDIKINKVQEENRKNIFRSNSQTVSNAVVSQAQKQEQANKVALQGLPAQLALENLGNTFKNSLNEAKTEIIKFLKETFSKLFDSIPFLKNIPKRDKG